MSAPNPFAEAPLVNRSENESWTDLHFAAHVGDVETINRLLAPSSIVVDDCAAPTTPTYHTVGDKDSAGTTALHLSAQNGHVDAVKTLLKLKANVEARTSEGYSPLFLAAQNGRAEVIAALLLEGKADPNGTTASGTTALHVAAQNGRVEAIRALLTSVKSAEGSSAIDVDVKNMDDYAALYLAAQCGYLPVVKALVEMGQADVDTTTFDGTTALHVAVERSDMPLVEYLLTNATRPANCEVQATDFMIKGYTALHSAAYNDNAEAIQLLVGTGKADVNAGTSDGCTGLHIAAGRGHVTAVDALLSFGASVNAANDYGWTPLFMASSNGQKKCVEQLLSQSTIDINVATDEGETALIAAVKEGYDDVVALLIAAKPSQGVPKQLTVGEDNIANMLEAAGLLLD